jgi:hypothetical protein
MSASAFLVFTIGNGQERLRASSSLSKFIIYLPRVGKNLLSGLSYHKIKLLARN